jgi:MATE family, multidrug efflux pump
MSDTPRRAVPSAGHPDDGQRPGPTRRGDAPRRGGAPRPSGAPPGGPRDYTSGPILRALLSLAGPIVLANVLQTVYQLTDTFWLGRLGADAVAAVSLSFPIIFLLISIGGGLAVAGAILVAQYYGSRDMARVDHVAAQTFGAVIAVSLLLSVVGYFLSGLLVGLLGAAPAVMREAVRYMQISFIGLVFVFAYFVFQSLMRGVGDVHTPLYVVAFTVVVNFFLDPLFILGLGPFPRLGVAGAAWATIGAQGLAALIGVALLFSGRYGIHLHGRDLAPDLPLIRRILFLGVPASVEQSVRALGLSVMMALVAGFGTTVLASYGIGTRILSFIIIPALGLSMATSTLVGQNIGAQKLDRAERTAWLSVRLAFGGLTGVGVLLFLLARPITAVFIPGDPQVIDSGARFIRIMAFSFGFLGVQQVLGGAFRGAGDTVAAMILAIVTLWVLRFPLAWLMSERTTLAQDGLYWSFPASNIAAALIAVGWFRRGRWRQRHVIETEPLLEEVSREAIIDEGLG